MTLHIFESTYRDLPCFKAVAVINKSKKLGIEKRCQKTYRAVGEVFSVKREEVETAFKAQASRWEKQTLERLKNGEPPDLKQEEIELGNRAWHCWNCRGELDPKTIKTLHDGTVVGTCWRCGHDDVSAIENDSEE